MASNEQESVENFYVEDDPEISDQARAILTQYSKVPESELVPHLRQVRDRAWAVFKYPCIGRWAFLDFGISEAPKYQQVLRDLKDGAMLLDLGCGLGQDVRKLIFDGAPHSNVMASDLEPGLFDVGYELFRDREKLQISLKPGDIFAPSIPGLEEHSFDYIYAGSFFHLWNWQEQVESMCKVVRLLKPKSGSMIFGRQSGVGDAEPRVDKIYTSRSGEMYRHNVASWEKLVAEVAEKTQTRLQVRENSRRQFESGPKSWDRFDFEIIVQ